jgi:hypothetical protein
MTYQCGSSLPHRIFPIRAVLSQTAGGVVILVLYGIEQRQAEFGRQVIEALFSLNKLNNFQLDDTNTRYAIRAYLVARLLQAEE